MDNNTRASNTMKPTFRGRDTYLWFDCQMCSSAESIGVKVPKYTGNYSVTSSCTECNHEHNIQPVPIAASDGGED